LFRRKLVVPTGVQAEGAAGGKATAALRDGVVGGGVMDGGIGRGSSLVGNSGGAGHRFW
jgi:hypothetical protein